MGFRTQDLLKEAGYEEGDYVPLGDQGAGSGSQTTTDTYSDVVDTDITQRMTPGLYTQDATLAATATGQANPNSDQISIRVRDVINGVTLAEADPALTGATLEPITVGPGEATFATSDTQIALRVQIKNSDNNTTVSLNQATMTYGVIL